MDCWSVLELPDDADARTIKRSYARLLKIFRPDEDPEGFQRLREAYEQALDIAQWGAEYAAEEPEVATADVVEQTNHADLQAWSDVLDVRPLSLQSPPPLRPLKLEKPLSLRPLKIEKPPFLRPLKLEKPPFLRPLRLENPPFLRPLNLELPPPLRSLNLAPSAHDPVIAPDELAARALLDGLSEHNLTERWAQAQQQHCAQAFEKLLLELCFDHPGLRNPIAAWAVQHLDWLAPWQNVAMIDWQRDALASGLLQDYRQALKELLEGGKEREFLTQLKSYTAQPWLQVFDRRQEWQRILLQLFNDTKWSLPLFDRVGQVFGWDDKKGIHPEPASLWDALIERCNQESFYENLQAKAQDSRTWAADVQAAHLLMNPMKTGQQKKMIDGFGQNEWQACHDLAHTLKWRYPELRLRLPHADVFHWRRFLPRPVTDASWVRVWAGIALALFLFYFPTEYKSKGFSISIPMMFIPLVFACVPVWLFRSAMSWWVPYTAHFFVQDLWLTEGLVPRHWNPDTRWLVMRHGVPQAVLTLLFGLLLGWPGMATYVGFMLIGLVHKRRIGQVDPELAARRPWLTALHWAHFSPLQLVFLLVMVGVIFVCRMYFPEYHLTHLMFS